MGTVFCSHRSSKCSSPLLSFSSVVWPLGYMAVRLVWKLQRMLLAESTENLLLEMPEGLDRLRMTSFIAELSIPSREQPRKEAEKEAKGNLLLNPVFLIPLSIMLLLVLDMVLVVVLFVGLGVFFLAKSR